MDDRARLDDRIFVLHRRLDELASRVSELENLRDRVTKAERKVFGATRKTREAVLEAAESAGQQRVNLNLRTKTGP